MKEKKKKHFWQIILVMIGVIFVVAGYLAYLMITDKSIFTHVDKILSAHLGPGVETSYTGNGTLYWPISNGAFAQVKPSQELQIYSNCDRNPGLEQAQFDAKLDTTMGYLDTYFSSINFKKITNPAFSANQLGVGHYILGYRNDTQGSMCVVKFMDDCIGDDSSGHMYRRGSLSCNSEANFMKATATQLDYLLAFGVPGQAIDMLGNYENYYYLDIGSPIGSGYMVWAKKSNNGWIKLAQNQLGCDSANKYKIPHQLYGADKCVDSVTQKLINNPN